MNELLYRYAGLWRYANRPGDPEACEPLQEFLNRVTPGDDAEIFMEISDEAELLSVRCNGVTSREPLLINTVEAVDSYRFLEFASVRHFEISAARDWFKRSQHAGRCSVSED